MTVFHGIKAAMLLRDKNCQLAVNSDLYFIFEAGKLLIVLQIILGNEIRGCIMLLSFLYAWNPFGAWQQSQIVTN